MLWIGTLWQERRKSDCKSIDKIPSLSLSTSIITRGRFEVPNWNQKWRWKLTQKASSTNNQCRINIDGRVLEQLGKSQFNATWATNRGIGILISNGRGHKSRYLFRNGQQCPANLPKHLTVQSDLQVPDNDPMGDLLGNEWDYTLETSLEGKFCTPVSLLYSRWICNNWWRPLFWLWSHWTWQRFESNCRVGKSVQGKHTCEFETVIKLWGGKTILYMWRCEQWLQNQIPVPQRWGNRSTVENNQYDAYLNIVDDSQDVCCWSWHGAWLWCRGASSTNQQLETSIP